MLTDSSMQPCGFRRVSRAAAALFLLAAAGCSIDSTISIDGPDPAGSAAVTITGAYTASSQGHAWIQSGAVAGTTNFDLVMAPVSFPPVPWMVFVHSSKGRPAVGTYSIAIAPGATMSARLDVNGASTLTSYVAAAGELVITSSSASSVRGTLRFTGTGPDGATVTVDSEFTAMCPPLFACM